MIAKVRIHSPEAGGRFIGLLGGCFEKKKVPIDRARLRAKVATCRKLLSRSFFEVPGKKTDGFRGFLPRRLPFRPNSGPFSYILPVVLGSFHAPPSCRRCPSRREPSAQAAQAAGHAVGGRQGRIPADRDRRAGGSFQAVGSAAPDPVLRGGSARRAGDQGATARRCQGELADAM